MNATVMVCTRLSDTSIVTTYVNIEREELYPMSIVLSEPPLRPIGQPTIPDQVGATAITVHRHEAA